MMDRGERAIRFIELLRHSKGELAGHRLKLEGWQRDYIRSLFGTIGDDGLRQYRQSLLFLPRKNGKSTLAAGIALYMLLADGELGAEVYSAAADRGQASIVFNEACSMVRQSPTLSRMCRIRKSAKLIEVPKTGSVYRALSAESYSKHGLNASAIIFDELHAQPNRDLWDVLTTSTASRRQPLTLAITTAGFDRHSICYELYTRAKQVLAGTLVDDQLLPLIFEADPTDDWKLEATWRKANPNFGVSVKPAYLRNEARKAAESPTYLNTFLRLHLNVWTESDIRWIDPAKWAACAGAIDPESLKGGPCWCGLDLSSTTDVTAFAMVFPLDGGRIAALCRFWIPGDNAHEREQRDRVPYSTWARDGWVKLTDGNVVDQDVIRRDIVALKEEFKVKEIAVDRWNATQLMTQLSGDGFNIVQFGQGYASMSAPTKQLEAHIIGGTLEHFDNPVLTWMAANAQAEQDAAGNVKLSKAKSRDKIDGMIALVMGLGRLMVKPAEATYDQLLAAMGGEMAL